ncbi:MAG: nucleoside deaminase [Lentimicrobiaceae bacterium]|nr:nucleoside deaminase [Lentimicrobiaceae bacterium]
MDISRYSDDYFMREALKEARKAFDKNEVPIGAVIACQNNIIARAHNLTETLNDPTAHAEMQAFTSACNYLGAKYLIDCTLYVTIEPCVMCAGAAFWSQITRIVYGAADPKRGYSTTGLNIFRPKIQICSGILENDCSEIIKKFFSEKRI